MGTNTVIRLPLHARSQRVLEVVARVAGEPYRLATFDKQGTLTNIRYGKPARIPVAFDPEQPSSKDNPWHVDFQRTRRDGLCLDPTDHDMGLGHLRFHDAAGQQHSWFWHTEVEDEQFKHLRPGAHALAVAVGRRLVRFFGGNMTYADYNDAIDYQVDPSQARLPPKLAQQTPDDRWYQFHGLLHEEGLLSQVELRQAMERMGVRKEEEELLPHLPMTELDPILEKRLPKARNSTARSRM